MSLKYMLNNKGLKIKPCTIPAKRLVYFSYLQSIAQIFYTSDSEENHRPVK